MQGLHQRRRLAWRSIAIALILLLPTGCLTVAFSVVGAGASAVDAYFDYKGAEKGEPVIVTPPIEAYSKELQDAATAEMRAIRQVQITEQTYYRCRMQFSLLKQLR